MDQSKSFNNFDENHEEIVHGENSVLQAENHDADEKTVVVIAEVSKITGQIPDKVSYIGSNWERNGTINVL